MKALTYSLIAIFACAVLTFTGYAGPEPIRDYKDAKTVVPVVEGCNWTGFYIGATGGGVFGDSDATDIDDYNVVFGADRSWSYDASGFTGGIQIGYNHQWKWLVLGIEGDLGYLGLDGAGRQPGSPGDDTFGKTDSDVYTTFRGKVGVAFNCFMLYFTGGGIGINTEFSVIDDDDIPPAGTALGHGGVNEFQWGYTLGGGGEYAFNRHWSVKMEYLFFSLERERFAFNGVSQIGTPFVTNFDTQTDGHILRGGLNYRF
jgi:outer membrane immunogenic protein